MVVKMTWLRDHVLRDGPQQPQLADFMCPITSKIMEEPVKAEDGYIYEHAEIKKWLEKSPTSPMTRKPMGKELVTDESLKHAIHAYQTAKASGEQAEICWDRDKEKRAVVVEADATPSHKKRRVEQEIGTSSISNALSRFFRELDDIRELLRQVLEGWEPPRIVVIGDESAGKSTILEQLANVPIFPRKRRFCTRMPIELRLRRDPDDSKAMLMIYKTQPDGSKELEGETKDIPQESGWHFVQEQMENLVREFGSGGLVTDRSIVVEVRHPNVPSIDLVDLPGLAGGEKKSAIDQILMQQLENDRKKGNHDMFLAVVPASGDVRPNTNMAMTFVSENNLATRSFGVFSKTDQTFDTEVLRALVLGESTSQGETPQDLGQVSPMSWVACMLKAPVEVENSQMLETNNFERLFLQSRKEAEFFKSKDDNMRRLVNKHRAGIPSLVQRLEKGYKDYLRETWGVQAMNKILAKLRVKEAEFKELGVVDDGAPALAQAEVKRRLEAESADVKKLYSDFTNQFLKELSIKLEKIIQDFVKREHQVCSLKESLSNLQKQLEANCYETTNDVLQHFRSELKRILEAETQRKHRITGKRNPLALFRAVGEIICNKDFIQINRYPTYTTALDEELYALLQQSVKQIWEDSYSLIASLVCVKRSPWLEFTVNEPGTAVGVSCDLKTFLQRISVVFLYGLPSPSDLQKAAVEVKLDDSSASKEFSQKAGDLKVELQKICSARDGLSNALFTKEELKLFEAAEAVTQN